MTAALLTFACSMGLAAGAVGIAAREGSIVSITVTPRLRVTPVLLKTVKLYSVSAPAPG